MHHSEAAALFSNGIFNVYLNESLTRKFVEKAVDANCDSEQLVKQIFICSVNKRNKSS